LLDIEERHLNDAEERIGAFIQVDVAPRKKRERRAKALFVAECQQSKYTENFLSGKGNTRPRDPTRVHELSQKIQVIYERKEKLHDEEQERRLMKASENNLFQALTIRKTRFPRDIPIQTWENHFSKMSSKNEITFEATKDNPIPVFNPLQGAKLQFSSLVPRITWLQAQTVSTTSI
jgi:hypothetical protein